jgi:dolichyl-phosphate mannosyltransferase polypeptide 2 regulatory subunit
VTLHSPSYAISACLTTLSLSLSTPHLSTSVKASGIDRVAGALLLLISLVVFVYYTLWVLVKPFIAPDHFLQAFFPQDHSLALKIPVLLIVAIVSFVAIFLGKVLLCKKKKKKPVKKDE